MSNPRGKTVPEVLSVYFIMLCIYCIDLFALKSDLTVLGDNFYSRVACFFILFIIVYMQKTSTEFFGISKKKSEVLKGLILGLSFSVIPLVIVTGFECLYYSITDITAIALRFNPPSLNYVKSTEHLTPAICIFIYIISTFVGSTFKEIFFRGYVMGRISKVRTFATANIIQALLYMSFIAPYLIRNLFNHYYDETTAELGLFIVLFYLFHETIAGIKWGLLTKASGSTYGAIFDHFLYVFLANSVYITDRYVTWSFMTHMLVIQIVSLIAVIIYYFKKKKMTVETDYSKPGKISAKTIEAVGKEIDEESTISSTQFKKIARTASSNDNKTDISIGNATDDEIDEFLQTFTEKHSPVKTVVKPPEPPKNEDDDTLNDNFDVNSFLENFSSDK